MGHPSLENQTPFSFEALFLADEDARPLFVPITKASYTVRHGTLEVAEKQLPVNSAGTFNGKPGSSSYRYEPETAFCKPATDVAWIGSARPIRPATAIDVSFRLGSLARRARVIGNRYWMKSVGGPVMTSPEPFESIPLIYELAFGGRDKTGRFEPRNPIGRGFHSGLRALDEGAPLPNIEDPAHPITSIDDKPAPMGFGFLNADWQPRAKFAGTYDDQWMRERMPLLPKDFDRRFFNAASPGLIAPGYLKGDEPVCIENASPRGTISFSLPGIPPPECRVQLTGRRDALVQSNLDTVIINTDEDLLILIWRGYLAVRNGPHDVVSIQIRAESVSAHAAAS